MSNRRIVITLMIKSIRDHTDLIRIRAWWQGRFESVWVWMKDRFISASRLTREAVESNAFPCNEIDKSLWWKQSLQRDLYRYTVALESAGNGPVAAVHLSLQISIPCKKTLRDRSSPCLVTFDLIARGSAIFQSCSESVIVDKCFKLIKWRFCYRRPDECTRYRDTFINNARVSTCTDPDSYWERSRSSSHCSQLRD